MAQVHVDFPLLQRLALPITVGAVRYPGIKIHDGALSACQLLLMSAVMSRRPGPPNNSTRRTSPLPPLRKPTASTNCATTRAKTVRATAHVCRRDGSLYCLTRLTPKVVQFALLFCSFTTLCGPRANSPLPHRPDPSQPASKLEPPTTASDNAHSQIVDLLAS